MKEVYIIEKEEFDILSVLIAECIISYSKKFYGFTMHSRDTGNEMGDSEMLLELTIPIRNAIKELGGIEK